jgi:hypothetical protein
MVPINFFRRHIVGIDTVLEIWIVFVVVSMTVSAVWLSIAPRSALLLTVYGKWFG